MIAALVAICGALTGAGATRAVTTAATPVAAEHLEIAGDPISRLVPVPPDAGVIFAVGEQGLYRSDNGGESWEAAGPVPPPGRLAAAGDGSILLAGNRPSCAQGGEETPLNRSGDGGATWEEVEGVAGVRPLAIWQDEQLAVGASCGGLEISTDAGRTWQPRELPDSNWTLSNLAVFPAEGQAGPAALIVGVPEGGGGRLWRLDLTDPATPQFSDVLREFWGTGAPAGRDQHYVLGTAAGVSVSDDAGTTWQQSRDGLEKTTISVDPIRDVIPDEEMQRGFGINAVAIDPIQPDHLYAGTVNGLFESTDNGTTWQRLAGIDATVTVLVLPTASEQLLAQGESGVIVLPRST